MKNLKRILSVILIASMIFTSNAMVTLAENENQVVSSEETTTDDIATVSDADEEVSKDAKLGEPEDGDNVAANETTATTTETTASETETTVAANTETAAETETTVEANETTIDASESSVGANAENVGANARGALVDDIATASDAEEDDNVKTDEEIKIASASAAEIKTNGEETFGAGSVYYAVAGTNPYSLYFSSSDLSTSTTISNIVSSGTIATYTYSNDRPWYSYRTSINKVEVLDDIAPTSMAYWFCECTNLSTIDGIDKINTSEVVSMKYLFFNCEALQNVGLQNFNTSNVTDMQAMFRGCKLLNSLDVSSFDTSNVTNMQAMFGTCQNITNLNLSNFNTSNVTDMSYMFDACIALTSLDLSSFNTSNVTNMCCMFSGLTSITNLDVSSFDTSNVTQMNTMFNSCKNITNLNLTNFNTSNVTTIEFMFYQCIALTSLDLSSFNTSNVTTMANMFDGCRALTSLDLSSFDTSNVTNMERTFAVCNELTIIVVDSSKFITTQVTNSNSMFALCNKLIGYQGTVYDSSHLDATYARLDDADNGNPGYFSEFPRILIYDGTTKIASASYLMSDIGNTVVEPVKPTRAGDTCVGWYKEQALTNAFNFASDTLPGNMRLYVKWGKEYTLPSGWKGTLTTLGRDFDNDIINITFEKHPTAAPTTSVSHATIPSSNGLELYIVANGTKYDAIIYAPEDGVIFAPVNSEMLFNTYHVNFLEKINNLSYLDTSRVTNMSYMFHSDKLTELDLSNFNTSNVTTMTSMFATCKSLTTLDLSSFDTSNVTNMSYMFSICEKLENLNISSFDTSNVTTMEYMFGSCKELTSLDLSSFNTSSVTTMQQMFQGCEKLTSVNLSSFDTSNVTDMGGMFGACRAITSLDLSNFNTSNVTDMNSMFGSCEKFTTIDVSSFDTSNVTDMGGMFLGCESLTTLDLSNFNTSNVTNMNHIFECCFQLTSLNISSFNTSNVTTMLGMFNGCYALTSLDVSNFDTRNVTDMEVMFAACRDIISLDISNFDTSNVTNMGEMFDACSKLNIIKVDSSKFNTTNVTNSNNMFNNCPALIGFEETKFDASHIDVSYAHIDAADNGTPGYFSEFPRIFVYDGTTRLARHDYTMANIGHTVAEPTKPTKTGYYFAGWYKEEALTNEFNFATDVLPGNMFLYVKWSTTPPTPPTPTTKTIKSVDINRTPRRTTYTEGDYIDPTGIVLKVTYDDNTTETITYDRKTKDDFTFKPALDTPLTTDDKEVVITYGKKTVRFSIVVDKKSDPTPSTGGNGGNSGGGSDPTKGPMGDLTKNPEYAKLLDPLANPLPAQPIDQTLNTTNNLPQEDLIYDTKLIDALKSFPENANPTKANVEDTDGNKGYGEWLNVPRTTTWYFLTGNLKPEDVASMSAKESGGFLRSGWYNLGWKGENKWYHFNTGGVMDIGWYTENNLIYYLEADLKDGWYGKAVTGTKVIDGITYNFGTNGALIP